jgi:hypothetical protein
LPGIVELIAGPYSCSATARQAKNERNRRKYQDSQREDGEIDVTCRLESEQKKPAHGVENCQWEEQDNADSTPSGAHSYPNAGEDYRCPQCDHITATPQWFWRAHKHALQCDFPEMQQRRQPEQHPTGAN